MFDLTLSEAEEEGDRDMEGVVSSDPDGSLRHQLAATDDELPCLTSETGRRVTMEPENNSMFASLSSSPSLSPRRSTIFPSEVLTV
jgi:hypothetical protein